MLAKINIIGSISVFFAVLAGIGCAGNTETTGTPCTVSANTPCQVNGVNGVRVCYQGREYCNTAAAAGASGLVSQAGANAISTLGKGGTTAAAGKGGSKTGAGGAKTTSAGGTKAQGTGGKTSGAGGRGAAGQAPTGTGGTVKTSGTGPRVPEITEECPNFRSGNISFMGVNGINVSAGPKAAGPTAPMLFYWHGTGSTSVEYGMMDGAISNGVTSEGGIIISFQGLSGSGDAMCSGTMIFDTGSFLLTDQLFACAVKNHNIDPKRVYVAGCSAGGLFSACMGANRSSYVAAVVPNSGGFVFPLPFEDDHTPALMTRHGAPGVDVVVIDFSTSSKTADDAFKGRGGFVVNCNHGGMHCGGGVLSAAGWEFMKAHPFGANPSPWKDGLPPGFAAQCAIY